MKTHLLTSLVLCGRLLAQELSTNTFDILQTDLPQPEFGAVAMAVIGAAIVTGGLIMQAELKHQAHIMSFRTAFPEPMNDHAPFWPLNSAVTNGKKGGLAVDITSGTYHWSIPAKQSWKNPNTGQPFTDAWQVRLKGSNDLKTWSYYVGDVWVDKSGAFVMLWCGAPCCGTNSSVIFFPMPDIGPDKGFVLATP